MVWRPARSHRSHLSRRGALITVKGKPRACRAGRRAADRLSRLLVAGSGPFVDVFRHFHPTEAKGTHTHARARKPRGDHPSNRFAR